MNAHSQEAERLLRLGHIHYLQGDYKHAHRYWQQAAFADPLNADVWQSLLKVVQSPEDRKICLQNILILKPNHLEARVSLDELVNMESPSTGLDSAGIKSITQALPSYQATRNFGAWQTSLRNGLLLLGLICAALYWFWLSFFAV